MHIVSDDDFEFHLPENPYIKATRDLQEQVATLEAYTQGILYTNLALLVALRESGVLNPDHALQVLHRFSSPPEGIHEALRPVFGTPFEYARYVLKQESGEIPDNVVAMPSPKAPPDAVE